MDGQGKSMDAGRGQPHHRMEKNELSLQRNKEHSLCYKHKTTRRKWKNSLRAFRTGFPFLKIHGAAEVGNGIMQVAAHDLQIYQKTWDNYLHGDVTVVKFVPASGAASRMFKNLFEFLDGADNAPANPFMQKFFNEIDKFAFYTALDKACQRNEGQGIAALKAGGNTKPSWPTCCSAKA